MKDNEIFNLIGLEQARQLNGIELIASENYVSQEVMNAAGSCLTNRYSEGLPGARYYGGQQYIDKIEQIAIDRAKELFGAEHANVQPHSGSQANMAAYMSMLKLGDKILSGSMNAGGHLTHSSPASFVTRLYDVVTYGMTYGVNEEGFYDYDEIRDIAKRERPKLIVAGASAYPRIIDFKKFRDIADEVGAYLMVDMAHIAGLVAGGVHPSPIPYADVVTTTTHKTLRGPRGGMILCKKELAKAVDSSVFPRTQGGPLDHIIAAKAICLYEALQPEFKTYAQNIVKNCQALAKQLVIDGIDLVTMGTDNHLMLVDLTNTGLTGKEAEKMLGVAHITVNKNMIPLDQRKPSEASGIRIGTAAITSRGMTEEDMARIGKWVSNILLGKVKPRALADTVKRFAECFPTIPVIK